MPETPAGPLPPQPPAQRRTTENQPPPGRRTEPTEAAVLLAQAEQRLAQERLVMQAQLDRERGLRRIQVAMGWLIVIMLPSVAVVCVTVMVNYETVPASVLRSATATFFVDIVGLVIAGWRTLLVWNLPNDPLKPVTQAPELHQQIDLETAEVTVVRAEERSEPRWTWRSRRPR
jgi:hypothetical protein